ncbi:YcaO-like family protein [Alkalilimnicola sp. S0819]|uniref:YcaO-like family protein n=1 Tax=Alkalilimnicola sp. S0819 TaxID=2613922 RepID=UPI0012614B6B|nr:YcaO-like family protein [Alkalilimnicola sp. S0819]KAB7624210.1 hypothetical protein F3N43_07425 [Alkalilimnicola sp. S0819]MPQ16465.1 hypothetical protein [Alkalilimnicola sp. S0819]
MNEQRVIPGQAADSRHGTQRLVAPARTLARIKPMLANMGITRCLDITGLDCLGIPVFCATRPHSPVLQISGGKGMEPDQARVAALMASIELYHAETPEPQRLRRASAARLAAEGARPLHPEALSEALGNHYSDRRQLYWTEGRDLISGGVVQVPASAVYFCEPALCATSTNGLASGNHPVEASLHALYELIERDAVSRLSVDGKPRIREAVRVVDMRTVDEPLLLELHQRIRAADSELVLMAVPGPLPVHTFWAVLLNRAPFSAMSTLNPGYGCHSDPTSAAAVAITEAAQARAICIHGSREDIMDKPVYRARNTREEAAYRDFDALRPNARWADVREAVSAPRGDLFQVHQALLDAMAQAGLGPVYSFDLSKPRFGLPVIKLIAPALRFNRAVL